MYRVYIIECDMEVDPTSAICGIPIFIQLVNMHMQWRMTGITVKTERIFARKSLVERKRLSTQKHISLVNR